MEREHVWKSYSEDLRLKMELFSKGYKAYLDQGKTERECVKESIALAREKGFVSMEEAGDIGPGSKVYSVFMGKTLVLFHVGKDPLEQGMNILGAHVDSPRLDLKQNPLYEDRGLAYLDTHYYGGIKKYQWVTVPLAIHGCVAKKDGSLVHVEIGEAEEDPVFCVTDLLVHLSAEQQEKKASKVIEGEGLDLLIGSCPLDEEEKEAVKANVLKILKEKYDFEEEDFLSAELEIVPAGKARDAGLDRSMILAYGHDDRVCAYPSLEAVLALEETPDRTACCFLCDKEEIGSVGATGAQSRFFENAVAELMDAMGVFSELKLRRVMQNSRMLSSDVCAAFDPLYPSVFEGRNSAYFGKGVTFNKYTGARGKSGCNDANAEFVARLRRILEAADVHFQTAELGKVDAGGGGTIAYIFAKFGMEVIDCGVPVLSMHAPWECICKADLFETFRCYQAFLKDK